MGLIAWLIIGGLAGWIAGHVMRGGGFGLFGNIGVGILGAVIGGFLGLISSVGLTVVSPSVWEATLGNPKASSLFPYTSPALFSMAIGFIGIWLFSVLDRSDDAAKEREAFAAQQVRSETGLGAAGASSH